MFKTPRDLLRLFKTSAEKEAEISEEPLKIETTCSDHFAQATVMVEIEGQTRIMNVFIKDLGFPSLS